MSDTLPRSHAASALMQRLETKTATIGVVGLGYVGLPVARAVHAAGYAVLGYDVDPEKIDQLSRGENYFRHLDDEIAPILAAKDMFRATSKPADLADADVIILCVPMPLGRHRRDESSRRADTVAPLIALAQQRG